MLKYKLLYFAGAMAFTISVAYSWWGLLGGLGVAIVVLSKRLEAADA